MSNIGDILLSVPTQAISFQDGNGNIVQMNPNYLVESHKVIAIDTSNRPKRIRPIADIVSNNIITPTSTLTA